MGLVNLSVSLLLIFPVEAARRPGLAHGGVGSSLLFVHIFDLALVPDQYSCSKQIQRPQSCFAWLPGRCRSLLLTIFISEQFGNYLEMALFVLPTI